MTARRVAIQVTLASGLAGAFEATRVALLGGFVPGTWFVVASFAALGALVAIGALRVLAALAVRSRAVRNGCAALASEDRRVAAAARALLVAVALLAIGTGAFQIAAWTHDRFRFHDAAPVALLQALAIVALVVAVAAASVAIDRRTIRLVGSRLLAGRRATVAIAIAIGALLVAPALVVHLAVPAFALAGVVTASVVGVAALGSAAIPSGRRGGLAAIAVVLAMLGGVVASHSIARGRGQLAEHALLGRLAARTLWTLADRDGDGAASSLVGGADCDDDDPRRAPRNMEWRGNGVDDNCNGRDLDSFGDRAAPRPPTPTPSGVPARPNIVLVTVDALRADHLGAWGYPRPTSPSIDAFASTATRFVHAYTSGPSTRLALPSLLTGRYASTLRFVQPPPTIAQELARAGYDTAAVLCCSRLVEREELRGFAEIDRSPDGARLGSPGQANAEAVADRALAYLAAHRSSPRPFFLWVHFYDPHHPYATPAGSDGFGDRDIDRYDAEIAHVDRGVGRVLAALDQHQLASTTVVALSADHGDEFGEHGARFHARSLYAQVIRVPLIVRAPGAAARIIETSVSIVDIAPTLLDLAGVITPPMINGHSLVPAIRGGPAVTRPILVELLPDRQISRDLIAVIAEGHKAIWDREANAWSLYGLTDEADARELGDAEPALLARLQALLLDLTDRELGQ